jgi:hypothetical protein
LTGNAANLLRNRFLTATRGAYTFTGNAANLRHTWILIAGVGAYTLTGNVVILSYSGQPSIVCFFTDVQIRAAYLYQTKLIPAELSDVTLKPSRLTGVSVDAVN